MKLVKSSLKINAIVVALLKNTDIKIAQIIIKNTVSTMVECLVVHYSATLSGKAKAKIRSTVIANKVQPG